MREGVVAVVLAAGAARRFGSPKQLANYDGERLVVRVTAQLRRVGLEEVVVVTGAHGDRVREVLEGAGVSWVHNSDWQDGMGRSLAVGVEHVCRGRQPSAILVALCDQPRIADAHYEQLLAADALPAATLAGGRIMAPAVFPPALFDALRGLRGDRGAASVLRSLPDLRTVVCDDAARDVDEPGDLEPHRL